MGKMKNGLTIPQYLNELTLKGQYYFIVSQLAQDLGLKEESARAYLSRLSKKGKVKTIRNDFGIITGHTKGVLDPSYFVHAMMNHLNSKYYVGLLSAASYWGASHQSPMTFFIVAEKVIKPFSLGNLKIEFITKNNFDEMTEINNAQGVGGFYSISSPELTAIDLLRFPKKSGHLNNVATVLSDLVDKIDFKKLVNICKKSSTPTATVQRLGYILDTILQHPKAKQLQDALKNKKLNRILLSVSRKEESKTFSQFPFDEKWKIYQNTTVEPD
jgi:predicted transcriptional regulator of viral defense system